jgi:hypothetical protein
LTTDRNSAIIKSQKERKVSEMTIEEKYYKKLEEYYAGKITSEEWCEFCTLVLDLLLEEFPNLLNKSKEKF